MLHPPHLSIHLWTFYRLSIVVFNIPKQHMGYEKRHENRYEKRFNLDNLWFFNVRQHRTPHGHFCISPRSKYGRRGRDQIRNLGISSWTPKPSRHGGRVIVGILNVVAGKSWYTGTQTCRRNIITLWEIFSRDIIKRINWETVWRENVLMRLYCIAVKIEPMTVGSAAEHHSCQVSAERLVCAANRYKRSQQFRHLLTQQCSNWNIRKLR